MEKKGKRYAPQQEPGGGEEINLLKKKKTKKSKKKKSLIPKWVYKVSLILLAAVLVLVWWFNRESLTPENISDWIQTRIVGMGVGDGYPVEVPGGESDVGNFLSVDGEAVLVSNTALTAWNSTGKETMSVQHSSSHPAVKEAGGRYLIYGVGETGYQINTHTRSLLSKDAEKNILTGAISASGRYALVTQSEDYASRMTVYMADGSVQYEYDFSQTHITAVALSADGVRGFAAGITAQDGGLVSVLYVFDFNQEEPVYTAVSADTLLLEAQWGEDGKVCAVGDRKILWMDTNSGTTEEYDYDGATLEAYCLDGSRALLSLSSYSGSDACRVLEFRASSNPVTQLETGGDVISVSLYGETLAVLSNKTVSAYSSETGESLGSCPAGSDARAIALGNESMVYILGVSEVRQGSFS